MSEAGDFYNKAGYSYWNKGEFKQAASQFEKACDIFKNLNNTNASISVYNNLGLVYSELELYKEAAQSFGQALAIARKAKILGDILNALINLSNTEIEIKSFDNALVHSKEALSLASELSNLRMVTKCYSLLAEAYEKSGNNQEAIKYYELFSSADKNLKAKEMADIKTQSTQEVNRANEGKRVTEIELKIKKGELRLTQDSLFITEKIALERKIENNNISSKLRQKEMQLRYEKNLRNILVTGILIIFVFLFLLGYLLKQKLQDNKLLRLQKEEITQQRNVLDIQNKKITDSIHYGLRIQQAMLPDLSGLRDTFEVSVIYNAKDIVSGDFYWYFEVPDKYKFFAVVDCTGHGVPGAFMSMIGNRLLNEVVASRKNYEPAQILEILNEILKKELHQDVSNNRDGMDIALCRIEKIDEGNYKLTFAGAKRPLYIFSHKIGKIKIFEGDNKTVGGIFSNAKSNFTEKYVNISRNDSLILFSDGITDQHNKERMRFGSLRFIKILEENLSKPFNECKTNIEHSLFNYKDAEDQRDDITIMALRLK